VSLKFLKWVFKTLNLQNSNFRRKIYYILKEEDIREKFLTIFLGKMSKIFEIS